MFCAFALCVCVYELLQIVVVRVSVHSERIRNTTSIHTVDASCSELNVNFNSSYYDPMHLRLRRWNEQYLKL